MKENRKKMKPGIAFLLGIGVAAGSVALYKNSAVVRTACANVGQVGKNLVKKAGDWIIKVTTPKEAGK